LRLGDNDMEDLSFVVYKSKAKNKWNWLYLVAFYAILPIGMVLSWLSFSDQYNRGFAVQNSMPLGRAYNAQGSLLFLLLGPSQQLFDFVTIATRVCTLSAAIFATICEAIIIRQWIQDNVLKNSSPNSKQSPPTTGTGRLRRFASRLGMRS